MLDVIDLGVFPGPDRSYLWLTILVPIILYAIACTIAAKANMKDDNDIGVYVFGFFLMVAAILLTSFITGWTVDNARDNKILAAVEDAGFSNVVELNDPWIADISAVDKDGKGYLFDFIELPRNHVGLLEVEGTK